MPVKQIQLRGISRTPSDRMNVDGGLAESFNMIIEQGECAPMIIQKDKTSELLSAQRSGLTPVYIHKDSAYTNYIMVSSDRRTVYGITEGGAKKIKIVDLSSGLVNVVAIGNTLILQAEGGVSYALWKDGTYKSLGSKIPKPTVELIVTKGESKTEAVNSLTAGGMYLIVLANKFSTQAEVAERINLCATKYYDLERAYTGADVSMKEWVDAVSSTMWSYALKATSDIRSEQQFPSAVFVRHAVKLYDGSYLYQSSPQIVGAFANTTINYTIDASNTQAATSQVTTATPYTLKYKISMPDLEDWKDIVKGVSIFRSTEILNPLYESRIKGAELYGETIRVKFESQSGYNLSDDFKKEALKKANFYEVDEVTSDTIPAEGWTEEKLIEPIKDEELVVKRELQDLLYSSHQTYPVGAMSVLNERVIYSGIGTTLDSGPQWLGSNPLGAQFQYKFYIRTDSGKVCTVLARDTNGNPAFRGPCNTWLYYPDPRCFKVEMVAGSLHYDVPMTEHPFLHGAYYMSGPNMPITGKLIPTVSGQFAEGDEDKTYVEGNKVVMTEVANPFVIPTGNRLTFDYEVISTATTTRALSQGQFGQYPLYVFCRGGIWSVALREDGTFAQSVPLSRDVALKQESITPIDQAVVFVTSNGVKMLTGSDILDLSPNMLGQQFVLSGKNDLDSRVFNALPTNYQDLLVSDNITFVDYMKDAGCGYDYNSSSLIFFRPDKAYQYVYRIKDQTWHKYQYIKGLSQPYWISGISHKLNSYPECYLVASTKANKTDSSSAYRILEFSLVPNGNPQQETSPGIMITRGIDLDESDIRKAIKSVRIRGNFNPAHVSYILMGSIDGVHYGLLPSLRGGSYKTFRFMLLCNLTQEERLSYIEIDYESRFTNKLR